MKKILLAGSTGQLGKYIFRELKQQGYEVRALARNLKRAQALFPDPEELVLADATRPESLDGCCAGIDVVISALGKSVSLRNQNNVSFQEVDYQANLNLLQEAKQAGASQFIYISAFGAEEHRHLAYFKAHADFSDALKASGITYSILQPTALFSIFEEIMAFARRGRVAALGAGDKRTNPIFEGDVAKAVVSSIGQPNQVIPLGGKRTYTRLELVQIACEAARYVGRIPKLPFHFVEPLLPMVKVVSRSLYDKLAFMLAVTKEDCIAPAFGELTLEEYFELEPQLSN
ncbi:SDR family oxidoreductase [Pontibacter roseus]|uniref:SDR family oxidoreductase n=1 Tax=Pontibacter roseus TaxID=336989 RepID=UPI0003745E7D|nr:SDR family oxidoreductase [Pontibacter roseus]